MKKLIQATFGFEAVLNPNIETAHLRADGGRRRRPRVRKAATAVQKQIRDAYLDWDDPEDWPDGLYLAVNCPACRLVRRGRNTERHPCRSHPNFTGAIFELPEHLKGRAQKALAARRQHEASPWAPTHEEIEELLARVAIPWKKSFGNPHVWAGRLFTLDEPWGCGCRFFAKDHHIPGKWLKLKSRHIWYAVRAADCRKGEFCQAKQYPIFPADVTINQMLKVARNRMV